MIMKGSMLLIVWKNALMMSRHWWLMMQDWNSSFCAATLLQCGASQLSNSSENGEDCLRTFPSLTSKSRPGGKKDEEKVWVQRVGNLEDTCRQQTHQSRPWGACEKSQVLTLGRDMCSTLNWQVCGEQASSPITFQTVQAWSFRFHTSSHLKHLSHLRFLTLSQVWISDRWALRAGKAGAREI